MELESCFRRSSRSKSRMVAHTDAQCVHTHCASVCATMHDFSTKYLNRVGHASKILRVWKLLIGPLAGAAL